MEMKLVLSAECKKTGSLIDSVSFEFHNSLDEFSELIRKGFKEVYHGRNESYFYKEELWESGGKANEKFIGKWFKCFTEREEDTRVLRSDSRVSDRERLARKYLSTISA